MMDKREIIEQIRQKSDTDVDYTQFEKKAVELYEKFAKEYSPPKLAELKGEALLDTIFLNPRQFRKNLCYELEFGECKILGGIGGGSAAKYGLYFSEKEKSWAEGHGRRFSRRGRSQGNGNPGRPVEVLPFGGTMQAAGDIGRLSETGRFGRGCFS